jgi:tetratricopeptide (TPR) repeat protein
LVALRRLFVISGVLGLLTFGYVLLAAPIDPERSPRARALTQRPPIGSTIARVREQLVAGLADRAATHAEGLVEAYPGNLAAMLEYAQALELSGRADAARDVWARMLTGMPKQPREDAGVDQTYHRARALWALGDTQTARELFLGCAYIEMSKGDSRSAYNAACYLAMGGAHEDALREWETSIGLHGDAMRTPGITDGWWRVDPDLAPLREDPRFWEAAERAGIAGELTP